MSRKDYIEAAKLIRLMRLDERPEEEIRACEQFAVQLFRGENPRFDTDRFLAACKADA